MAVILKYIRSRYLKVDRVILASFALHLARADGRSFHSCACGRCLLQATVLERVVMTAERSVHKLSRASGVRLATNLQVTLFAQLLDLPVCRCNTNG